MYGVCSMLIMINLLKFVRAQPVRGGGGHHVVEKVNFYTLSLANAVLFTV